MIERPISTIDRLVIEQLLEDGQRESKTLDYKLALNIDKPDDRKELARDVIAFANTSGGDLVFGIEEDSATSAPTKIHGVPITETDEDGIQSRIHNILRDNITPRLSPQEEVHFVRGFERGPVVILRIKRSWQAPHMLRLSDSRFYKRSPKGKYPMDRDEIRLAFAATDEAAQSISKFIDERVRNLYLATSFSSPRPDPNLFSHKPAHGPGCVFHVVPVSAYSGFRISDLPKVYEVVRQLRNSEFMKGSASYNLDGVLKHSKLRNDYGWESYTQFFRNGSIEGFLHIRPSLQMDGFPNIVELTWIKLTLNEYMTAMRVLDVPPPFAIYVTVLHAKDMTVDPSQDLDAKLHVFPSNRITSTEGMIMDIDTDQESALNSCLDVIWQSAGMPKFKVSV